MAKTVGDTLALEVYKNLLGHTRKEVEELSVNRYLFYDKKIEKSDAWADDKFIKSIQAQGDLGERMSAAFQAILLLEKKVIIIGSDCPEISSEVITNAFIELDQKDVVIGPTHDGGYYLLGMKTLHESLFSNMTWSTSQVFNNTINEIESLGLSYNLLPKLHDLDTENELNKFPMFRLKDYFIKF